MKSKHTSMYPGDAPSEEGSKSCVNYSASFAESHVANCKSADPDIIPGLRESVEREVFSSVRYAFKRKEK